MFMADVSLPSARQGLVLSYLQVPTGLVKISNKGVNGSLFTFGDAIPQNVFIQHNTNDYPGGSFVVS